MINRTFDYRRAARFIPIEAMVISDERFYLIETQNNEDIGAWMFVKFKDGLIVHAEMSEQCRGKKAIESLKNAIQWIFDKTSYQKVYAGIPKGYERSGIVAANAGMNYTHKENDNRFFEVEKCQVH